MLSDRFGARPFATGGMLLAALSFVLLLLLPVNFSYWAFAVILVLNGFGLGLFASPNRAGIMNAVPANQRGVGAGMVATFQNSAIVLSIGIFFTLMVVGLASLARRSADRADRAGRAGGRRAPHLAPAAGRDAVRRVPRLQPDAAAARPRPRRTLSAAHQHYLTGREFFPHLISGPFHDGLRVAFVFADRACLIAAGLLAARRQVPLRRGGADRGDRPLTTSKGAGG